MLTKCFALALIIATSLDTVIGSNAEVSQDQRKTAECMEESLQDMTASFEQICVKNECRQSVQRAEFVLGGSKSKPRDATSP